MTNVFSWQNSISLCPASFCTPRPNFPVTPGILSSLVAPMVKPLPTMQEAWMRSLGQEGPLEKEMVTHSSILAWKIPCMKEHGSLQSMGLQSVRQDRGTSLSLSFFLGIS